MNKQEVISKLKSAIPKNNVDDYQRGEVAGLNFALLLLAELDEPEKPVVPQFVADWYEEHKDNFEIYLSGLCINFTCHRERLNDKLANWYEQLENKPIQTLVNMHQFGYEVEKEKLYTVEIPNPNGGEYGRVFLGKYSSGKVGLHCWTSYKQIKFDDSWKKDKIAQLTEAEIKKDFDWAWKFAEEV